MTSLQSGGAPLYRNDQQHQTTSRPAPSGHGYPTSSHPGHQDDVQRISLRDEPHRLRQPQEPPKTSRSLFSV